MKAVKRKLKSGAGASILISLMFFLVVMMVGAVCLVAAYNNSGRATHARDDLQRYYAVQSAINLIQEDLKKEAAEFVLTPVDDTFSTYKVEIPVDNRTVAGKSTDEPRYGRLVFDLMKSTFSPTNGQTYEPRAIQGITGDLALTAAAVDNGTSGTEEATNTYNADFKVKGVYTLGTKTYMVNPASIDDLDFTVVVSVWVDDDTKSYATTLTFPAYVRETKTYNADETITTKIYVTWDDPQTGRQEA